MDHLPLRSPVDRHSETVDVAACHLADALTTSGRTPGAAEDPVHVIETLADALALLGPEAAAILAPMLRATAALNSHLSPSGEPSPAVPADVFFPSAPQQRRRGLVSNLFHASTCAAGVTQRAP
ncbi:hypothetical protein [Streptomyces sp. NPDC050535]|uniref:hypothetical protein n=1 Tax=Streptomyces sp. NPDC050535 TaxID=3365626 RepID=UPI003795F581